ncbi:MAG: phasin family protein, partial [Betaproteobacteria bacterium]|nr:phasin family protein [Betaproteobacteria bacterium]
TTFDTQGLQSVLDGQLALGLKAVEAIEQLGALQVKTTKALIEQTTEQQAALLGTKSPQELSALASGASQPLAEISLSYLTEATALAMDTSRAVALTVSEKAWSQFLQQAHVASEQVELYVVQPTETQKAKGRRKA